MAQTLGRYHIISELGRGGMGVVYKALDPKLERFIAIKCLSEELSEDEIVVARFLREARNVAALNHPNIAQIFVADEHEGKPYFVMEYVDGESLADFIDREGQCSPEMARRVTEQAATALAAASEEGIVHRDVKPGNIMLDRRGRAVLTDFGIACVVSEQSESGSQSIMGTPGYLPPEALTGDPVDQRGDMFSLGAVLFEMLTGERLIPGRDLKQTFAQLAKADFPDLTALEGKVDDRMLDILRRLLAVKPESRYANWNDLLEDMAPLKTGHTGPVERPDSAPSTAEREVTEALATARTQAAAAPAPEATAVLEQETKSRHPVPVPKRKASSRAGRWLAIAAVLVVMVALAGFGLARMDTSTWNRMTAWLPGSEPDAAAVADMAAESGAPAGSTSAEESTVTQVAGSGAAARAGQAVAQETGAPEAAETEAGPALDEPARNPTESSSGEASFSFALDESAQGDPGEESALEADAGVPEDPGPATANASETGAPEASSEPTEGQALAMNEGAAVAAEPRARSAAEPATKPQTVKPPEGIVVIGVGDPVVADPMVREIESALRAGSRPLVQREVISGYRRFIEGEEVDLPGLADPALAAGARYVVIARALPAGERELQYYNRIETAFIAQLEAVTYDLHAMRQLGASPVEQIEFTALNATERAIASVQPWLAGIRGQFD